MLKPYDRVEQRLRRGKDYLHLARLLQALGASPLGRAKIVVATCLMPLKRRVPRLSRRWIRFDIAYGGRRLAWHVSDASELIALADVLCHEQYRLPDTLAPRTIVDLGSNIGGSVLYFAGRYPTARIYGVEPDPATFAKLKANVAPLENVDVVPVAVGDCDGEAEFFPNPHTWASSLKPTFATTPGITVPVRTLDTLLDEIGLDRVDLVKLDIEGSEYDVLRAFRGLPTRAGALIGELHSFLPEVYAATERFLEGLEGFDVTYDREGRDHLFLAVAACGPRLGVVRAPDSAHEN
ncbi:MAG: FkbM family methyltransferase [Solirubrobacteraceae bacterium]